MLQDVVNDPPDIDDTPSPLSGEIFELCDPDLFQEALQNSEVNSNHCSYEENNSNSYTTNLSFASNQNHLPNQNLETYTTKTTTASTTTTPTTTTATINNTNFSTIFDTPEEIENDISASIDFSQPTQFSLPQFPINQQDQFDLSSFQPQAPLTNTHVVNGLAHFPPLPSVFEDECLSSLIPSYPRLNSNSSISCSFLEPQMGPYLPSNLGTTLSAENSGIFNGNLFMGNEFQPQELEFQGDNGGIFCPDQHLPRIYNSSELQGLRNESQVGVHVMNGGGGSSATPLATEVPSLEDSAFKAAKLSAEERKEKIHRYMKKRSERNFSKKIKYACRKTLADSRPRVRGRFAKNDELGDMTRGACSNHEEDTDEDVVVKEEEEMVDSSDIFAHISGVNSFKCNYPIQSWI
ncbi:uncharacterized protein LOC130787026 isoform X1 [Actinidia eriantha]|uniref:uncharacterized protein LOC130787026 isoform X1 n=1 Tax=Actinidia eriantha TaxID=165200 RepID=UPI00258C78ED|nr:uncharacterized protein LOC130787026 isoform X1 [Actinidia eriantha]